MSVMYILPSNKDCLKNGSTNDMLNIHSICQVFGLEEMLKGTQTHDEMKKNHIDCIRYELHLKIHVDTHVLHSMHMHI
jgi:hypothetical protein